MNPRRFRRIREVLNRRQPDLAVLMERVNKPHNFSAILRNCDATGVLRAHVVRPKGGMPLHNHVAAGAARWVEVRLHESVQEAVAALRHQGFTILAAHPTSSGLDFREADLTVPVALMIGAELEGLSPEGLALADQTLSIPMSGMVRSLNVSVATALLLFEAYRQRAAKGMYENSRLTSSEYERLLFEWSYPEIARVLRAQGQPYPDLSSHGEILP
jgi:tRNA (guanosine-2'-O-)-methyltransferase